MRKPRKRRDLLLCAMACGACAIPAAACKDAQTAGAVATPTTSAGASATGANGPTAASGTTAVGPAATGPTATGPTAASGRGASAEACVDAWLSSHQLNEYGDPPGTMYAGGTPLFDEASGRRTDRLARILAKHPEVKKACPPSEASDR